MVRRGNRRGTVRRETEVRDITWESINFSFPAASKRMLGSVQPALTVIADSLGRRPTGDGVNPYQGGLDDRPGDGFDDGLDAGFDDGPDDSGPTTVGGAAAPPPDAPPMR